jgi:hypothetical protein
MKIRTVLLLVILTVHVSMHPPAMQRQAATLKASASESDTCLSGYKIAGTIPKGYEDFLMLWVDDPCICQKEIACDNVKTTLAPDAGGKVRVCGRVVFKGSRYPQGDNNSDGKYLSYEFAEARLAVAEDKLPQLIFSTRQHDGISYKFAGRYSADFQLNGTMIRLKDGKRVSKIKIAFTQYRIIE